MSQINETPDINGRDDAEGFKTAYLTRVAKWSNLTLSKQFTATLINQLYTISIKSRKPIGKTYALVRPNPCEHSVFGSLIFKKDQNATQKSCCTNRVTPRTTRQPNWNHVDRGNLVHHPVDTMMERAVRMTLKNNGR